MKRVGIFLLLVFSLSFICASCENNKCNFSSGELIEYDGHTFESSFVSAGSLIISVDNEPSAPVLIGESLNFSKVTITLENITSVNGIFQAKISYATNENPTIPQTTTDGEIPKVDTFEQLTETGNPTIPQTTTDGISLKNWTVSIMFSIGVILIIIVLVIIFIYLKNTRVATVATSSSDEQSVRNEPSIKRGKKSSSGYANE